MPFFSKLIRSFHRRGVRDTFSLAARNPLYLYHKYQERRFDRVHGTETGQTMDIVQYDRICPNREYAGHYQAVTQKFFYRMMKVAQIRCDDFVFVDLGSGKGRALMLAAGFPFKRIIGVEMSPELHSIAESNLRSFMDKKGIADNFELHCMDAESFHFPEDNLVLFLYNPFHGKVMSAVIDKIREFLGRHPFRIIIMYRNPKCADLFDGQDFLKFVGGTPHYGIYTGTGRHLAPAAGAS